MFMRSCRFLFVLVFGFLALAVADPTRAEAQGRRLALVVGNEAYQHLPGLATPAADAQAMSKSLRDLGFEVTLLTDVGPEVFQAVLDTFAKQAADAETVLFFYSGHAFQKDGINHLVPVSARLGTVEALDAETWRLDDIVGRLRSGSAQVLVFLDACRTSPVAAALTGGGDGLAQFDGGAGTFVSFATRPGSVAFDTEAGSVHSPFTNALINKIAVPGQSISDLMIGVRNDVYSATGGKQTPWDQSSLRAQFYFAPVAAPEVASAPTEDAMPAFDIVESSSSVLLPGATTALVEALDPNAKPISTEVEVEGEVRLAALNSKTRSLSTLSPIDAATAGTDRVKGIDAGAPKPEVVAIPADLPAAVQGELTRIGCYAMAVDGDWGNGSRNAMRHYYTSKKVDAGEVEPTEAVYLQLLKEPEKTCETPAAVIKKKVAAKPATTKKKPAAVVAPTPAPAPSTPKVTCKFMLVAVVCS